MPPCAGGPTEALELPHPLISRRKTAIQEVEVSRCDSMTGRSERTSIQGKEEAHTILEQTHDQLQLSYITRSEEEDDDSLALFDPDDFSRETWTDIIYQRIDPPLVPLAVIAAATVILHPLIFIAGAATALGAVHMIGHGFHVIWGDETPEKDAPANVVSSMTTSIPTSVREVVQPNPTFETMWSEEADGEDLPHDGDWLPVHFPPLGAEVAKDVHFEGLNALEFYKVFIGDDAPYTFKEFQKQRGDIDIEYGSWIPLLTPQSLSMHPQAPSSEIPQHSLTSYERTLSFKTLTKSYFGPPYALAFKKQRIHVHKRLMILESRVELKDIPFCDRFFVLERWILHSPKLKERKRSFLNVHSQVFFSQQCTFEPQIRTKSLSTLKDILTSWCQMAQQVLEITIKHKLERERRRQDQNEEEDCIEVTHSDSSGSVILGDENLPPADFPPMVVVTEEHRSRSLKSLKRNVLQRMVRKASLQ